MGPNWVSPSVEDELSIHQYSRLNAFELDGISTTSVADIWFGSERSIHNRISRHRRAENAFENVSSGLHSFRIARNVR